MNNQFSVDAQKNLIRKQAAQRRDQLAKTNTSGGFDLAGYADSLMARYTPQVVAGYWPVRSELNLLTLLKALQNRGVSLCLPITGPLGTELSFHHWPYGTALTTGRYGIKQPCATAEQLIPDVICLPLLAFDKDGHRLGYGGGYYDRTLAELRTSGYNVVAVGMAYLEQEVERLPIGPFDQPLDDVLTPAGWLSDADKMTKQE